MPNRRVWTICIYIIAHWENAAEFNELYGPVMDEGQIGLSTEFFSTFTNYR